MFVWAVACRDGLSASALRDAWRGGCVCYVDAVFVADRAVSPVTGVVRWVVVDAGSFDAEAVAFLASLRARGCSPNTERVYAGRVALYLSYCRVRRLDWRTPGFLDLAGLQRWLVQTPLPARVQRHLSMGRRLLSTDPRPWAGRLPTSPQARPAGIAVAASRTTNQGLRREQGQWVRCRRIRR